MKALLTLIGFFAGLSLGTSPIYGQATATSGTAPASTGTTIGTTPGGGTTAAPTQPDANAILRDQAGRINALRNIETNRRQGNQPDNRPGANVVNPTPGLDRSTMRTLGVGDIQITPANRPAGETPVRYIKTTVRRPVGTAPDDSEEVKKEYQYNLRESLNDSAIMDLLMSETSANGKIENELAKNRISEDVYQIGPDKAPDGSVVSFIGESSAPITWMGVLGGGGSSIPVYYDNRKQDDEFLAEGEGKQADGIGPGGTNPDGTYSYKNSTVYFYNNLDSQSVKYRLLILYSTRAAWNSKVLVWGLADKMGLDEEDLLARSDQEAQLKADQYNKFLYKRDKRLAEDNQIIVYLITEGDPLLKENRVKAERHLDNIVGKNHRAWFNGLGLKTSLEDSIEKNENQKLRDELHLNSSSGETGGSSSEGSEDHNDDTGQNLGNPGRNNGRETGPGMTDYQVGDSDAGSEQTSPQDSESAASSASSSAASNASSSSGEDAATGSSDSENSSDDEGDDEGSEEGEEGEEDWNGVARGVLGGEERESGSAPRWAIESQYADSVIANGGRTGNGATIRFGEGDSGKPGHGPLNEKGINSGSPDLRFDSERVVGEGEVNITLLESRLNDPTIRLAPENGGNPNGTPEGIGGEGTNGPPIDPHSPVSRDLKKATAGKAVTNEVKIDVENIDFNGSPRKVTN